MNSIFDDYKVICDLCGKELIITKEHNHLIIQDIVIGTTDIENLCNDCKKELKNYIKEKKQNVQNECEVQQADI